MGFRTERSLLSSSLVAQFDASSEPVFLKGFARHFGSESPDRTAELFHLLGIRFSFLARQEWLEILKRNALIVRWSKDRDVVLVPKVLVSPIAGVVGLQSPRGGIG